MAAARTPQTVVMRRTEARRDYQQAGLRAYRQRQLQICDGAKQPTFPGSAPVP